jgi:outer membrane biosynthesis protein TonB
VVGFLALAAIVLVIFLVKGGGKSDDDSTTAGPVAGVGPGETNKDRAEFDKLEGTKPGEPAKEPGKEAEKPGATTPPVGGETPGAEKPATPKAPREKDSTPKKPRETRETRETREPEPAPAPTPVKKPAGNAPCDEVACLVDSSQPCCQKASGGSRSSGGSSERTMPEKVGKGLEKPQIQKGVNGVRGRVMSCNDQYKVPGTVEVRIVISPDGDVSSATVKGKFAGTPTGSCVERAIKSANFDSAEKATTVNYPFIFR